MDAFNRRDRDAFLELMAKDVEGESRLVAMEGGYHGHAGVERWWDNLLSIIPDYRLEVHDVRSIGEVTIAKATARGHGADSDAPLVEAIWQPGRWRDGRCVWWTVCRTESEAREAAGLPPEG